jgi:hypothetical protein
MTQTSYPWAGEVTGDAGPYTDDQWTDMFRKFFLRDRDVEGIIPGYLNGLHVTGVASPVAVNTGGAIVDGKFYENDASVNVTVPTPAAQTRVDLIVLEKDFAAQTVRIARHAGSEGAGAPSPTQTDGTTWEIVLAEASITTGGVITLTDRRKNASSPLATPYVPGLNLEIDAGAIEIVGSGHYIVDTEGAAASDILDTITGGISSTWGGELIIIRNANSSRVVQVQDGAGIILADSVDHYLKTTESYIMLWYDGTAWREILPGPGRLATIEFAIDGGGAELATGEYSNINIKIPWNCYIVGAYAYADQSGSVVVDLWNDTHANYPPTVGDSIVASAPITISTADKSEDLTLTGWTRQLTRGDIMRPNVNSVTTIEAVTIALMVVKN